MTDIMKLAAAYATSAQVDGRHDFDSSKTDQARAALQSAIEALQATQANQSMQLAHDAVTIECLNDKVMALQYEVDAIAGIKADRDQLQAENERLKATIERNTEHYCAVVADKAALQAKLDAGKGEPVQFLCDATRFKVRQHEGDEAGRIFGLPSELNGRWVALVAADDDCHLKLAAPKALAPTAFQRYEPEIWREDRIRMEPDSLGDWVKWSDVNAAIGGAP